MMRGRNSILSAYNFSIDCASLHFRASKVRSIEQEIEVEEICEGGLNGYVHTLVKPASKAKRLIFERGYCIEPVEQRLEQMLGEYQTEPLSIFVYDRTGRELVKTYWISGWMPVRWQLSDFDAQEGGLLIETIELVYETLQG